MCVSSSALWLFDVCFYDNSVMSINTTEVCLCCLSWMKSDFIFVLDPEQRKSHMDACMSSLWQVSILRLCENRHVLLFSEWKTQIISLYFIVFYCLLFLLCCISRDQSDSGKSSSVFRTRTGPAMVQCSEERPAHLWRPHLEDTAAKWGPHWSTKVMWWHKAAESLL